MMPLVVTAVLGMSVGSTGFWLNTGTKFILMDDVLDMQDRVASQLSVVKGMVIAAWILPTGRKLGDHMKR